MNKYTLLKTDTKINLKGKKLFRIQAKIGISPDVAKGDLGGYIESTENLADSGNAWVYGNAEVHGDAWVSFGLLDIDFKTNLVRAIATSLNLYPVNQTYTLFKRVTKLADGKYCSEHDPLFIYMDGAESSCTDADENPDIDCGKGIHVSTPFYNREGVLIAVSVQLSDIICCLSGKIRCRKVTTIGEIKEK